MADIKYEFEDSYQQYYGLIFLSLHRYRGECNIKTWMCKIALNVIYKYFKKNPQTAQLDVLLEAVVENVIIYRTYLQLNFNEISQMMNISENSEKVTYARGKE